MHDRSCPQSSMALLLTLALATLTATMGLSVATVLLPTLSKNLSQSLLDVQWVVSSYLIAVSITIVSAGRLGDLIGYRRVLLFGLILFIASSALCAAAPGLGYLITGRIFQGVGGAILIALSMSLARDLIPSERLGTAMGLLGTTSAVGTALGPSLGGVVLTLGSWRMVFWLLAGLALLTLVLAITHITRDYERKDVSISELDIPGSLLLVITLTAFALLTSGSAAYFSLSMGILVVITLAAVLLFIFAETRATSPLVPMTLLIHRRTGIGLIMNLLVGVIMMCTLVVGPYFLVYSLGLSEMLVGLVMAVGPAVSALSGVPAGRLTDRLGVNRVMLIGLVQTCIGLLCLAYLPKYFGVGGYVLALITLTPAFQLFLAANNTAVLIDAAKEERGRLSGLLGLSRNIGLMTGASAMSSLYVFFLGTGDVAQAAANDVTFAFSMTFTVASGFAITALGLAVYSHAGIAKTDLEPSKSTQTS